MGRLDWTSGAPVARRVSHWRGLPFSVGDFPPTPRRHSTFHLFTTSVALHINNINVTEARPAPPTPQPSGYDRLQTR